MKNSLFDSLFLVNLSVFPSDFCVFLKRYHVRLSILWKWGLEQFLDDVGFVPSLSINAENLSFFMFLEPYVHAGLGLHVHASWLHAQANSCVRMSRASLALLFQKWIYLLIKNYIFHFNISQVNLTSD